MGQNSSQPVNEVDEMFKHPVPMAQLQSMPDPATKRRKKEKKAQLSDQASSIPVLDDNLQPIADTAQEGKKDSQGSQDTSLSSQAANGRVESFVDLKQSPPQGKIPEASIQASPETKKKKKKKSLVSAEKDLPSPTADGHAEPSTHLIQPSPSPEQASPVSSKRKRDSGPELQKKKKRRHSIADLAHATEPERKKKRKKRQGAVEGFVINSELNVEDNEGNTPVGSLTESQPKKKKKRNTMTDLESPHDKQLSQETEPKKKKKSEKKNRTSENNEAGLRSQALDHARQDAISQSSPVIGDRTPRKDVKGRSGGKENLTIGHFTAAEVEKLEDFKVNFCNIHGISGPTFDEMVQHSMRSDNKLDFPCPNSIITKNEFWTDIYGTLPNRDRRSVYRFMRRHFQDSTQKPHDWSKAQDEELIDLIAEHGQKWAYIAKLLGRSDDDVVQRWKNRLEHRGVMRRGAWTEEEMRALLNALQVHWERLQTFNPQAAGKDIYEMDDSTIGWSSISDLMKNVRSRQQAADKWRKIRRQVDPLRASGQSDAVYDPAQTVRGAKSWLKRVPSGFKSSEFVEDENSDGAKSMDTGLASMDDVKGESMSESAGFGDSEDEIEAVPESEVEP